MEAPEDILFKAIVFDLDGVITKTAVTHTEAWKKTFDGFLKLMAQRNNMPFREFTQNDYLDYVDGKPRYEGVKSFLESRDIHLQYGSKDDGPGEETICGLGNRKNVIFNEVLEQKGTEVYPSSKKLLLELVKAPVKIGVASSSKNCKRILEVVDLLPIFDARVDGIVSEELGLKGKPNPDIFIKACRLMGCEPGDCIVVEDAVSGVQAGASGNFGLTLGVARKDNARDLQENGADFVVSDLEEVGGVEGLNNLFMKFRSA